MGLFLVSTPGVQDAVRAKYDTFVQCKKKLHQKKEVAMRTFNSEFCIGGRFLPVGVEKIRSEGLIEDELLKIMVVMKIPESEFKLVKIFKKRVTEKEQPCHCGTAVLKEYPEIHEGVEASKLKSKISRLFNFKIYTSDRKVFRCSPLVLDYKSPYLHTLMRSDSEEAKKDRVTFGDFDISIIREVLRYIYTDEISPDFNEVHDLLIILEAAERFCLPKLKLICKKNLGIVQFRTTTAMVIGYDVYQDSAHRGKTVVVTLQNLCLHEGEQVQKQKKS